MPEPAAAVGMAHLAGDDGDVASMQCPVKSESSAASLTKERCGLQLPEARPSTVSALRPETAMLAIDLLHDDLKTISGKVDSLGTCLDEVRSLCLRLSDEQRSAQAPARRPSTGSEGFNNVRLSRGPRAGAAEVKGMHRHAMASKASASSELPSPRGFKLQRQGTGSRDADLEAIGNARGPGHRAKVPLLTGRSGMTPSPSRSVTLEGEPMSQPQLRRKKSDGVESKAESVSSDQLLSQQHLAVAVNSFTSEVDRDNWPGNVQMRVELEQAMSMAATRRPSQSLSRSSSDMVLRKGMQGANATNSDNVPPTHGSQASDGSRFWRRRWSPRPLRPESPAYLAFQLVSIIVLVWDLMTIPFVLAWSVEEPFISIASLVSTLFWTSDVCLSFAVGYFVDGVVKTRFPDIAKHYLRTWFMPDMMVVMADWSSIVLVGGKGEIKLIRLFKIVRVLRVLAVIRLAKAWRAVEDSIHHSLSENSRLVIRVAWLCALVLILNHVIACVWFGVGRTASSDTGMRWTDFRWGEDQYGIAIPFLDTPKEFQYTTALHWALAQITLGANEVNSTNSAERSLQVSCLLLGLVCGSTFISTLSAAIFDYHAQQEDQNKSQRALRRFLRQHHVDSRMAFAVQRQVAARLGKAQHISEDQVEALKLLRPELKAELDYVINKESALSHSLLQLWAIVDVKSVWRACGTGTMLQLLSGEELFDTGMQAENIYYFLKGSIMYSQDIGFSVEESHGETRVPTHSWLAEAALWTEWMHVGGTECLCPCEVWQVNVEAFLGVLKLVPAVQLLSIDYGRQMHARIIHARPPLQDFPNDVRIPETNIHELAFTMGKDSRVKLGLAMLESARYQRPMHDYSNKDVKYSVTNGRSLIFHDGNHGELFQVRASIALNIQLSFEEDTELVYFASYDGSEVEITAKILEFPRELGELSQDCLQRVLREDLHSWKSYLRWYRSFSTSEKQLADSKTAGGTPIMCLQTVYKCVLDGEPKLPVLELRLSEAEQFHLELAMSKSAEGRATTLDLSVVEKEAPWRVSRRRTIQRMKLFLDRHGQSANKTTIYAALPRDILDVIAGDKALQQKLQKKLQQNLGGFVSDQIKAEDGSPDKAQLQSTPSGWSSEMDDAESLEV